ncbi:MAG TPA: zinc-binding dehydrogenase, partial [Saprospiraceae bacterium]|nr:zinc-binding dehydrogenase [Saprospiraceae bacterium]
RVLALTRFGGYAEFVTTESLAVVPISEEMPVGDAVALATQYITAYYCAEEMVQLNKGDNVLIHAAAGGVGTALVQIAKNKGCIVYGTASASKLKHLKEQGVDFPIDYQSQDFSKIIANIVGESGIDVIFDSIGGYSVRKGYRLLGFGGKIVCFGGSDLIAGKGNIFKLLRTVIGFGLYSPIHLLNRSKSLLSVNMLHIADHHPDVIQKCLKAVVDSYNKQHIKPIIGGIYNTDEIGLAHELLENRKTIGKIVVKW